MPLLENIMRGFRSIEEKRSRVFWEPEEAETAV